MLLHTDFGYLDVFDYVPGLPDEDVHQLFDETSECDGIRFVSLEWLVRMKRAAGRRKNLDDLENLLDV